MQFEAGGQPSKGTDSPFPKVDFPPAFHRMQQPTPGLLTAIARAFRACSTCGIATASKSLRIWIGEAAQHHPDLVKEIVDRGHEAAGHGPHWSSQYAMSREEERTFLAQAASMVETVTGQRPIGYNCNWLRRSPNTLSPLQELGYVYHIDDVSRDEPFIEQVNGKDFVVIPYTLHNNDILLIEGRNYSPAKFLDQIKLDFDQLYDEADTRRRMMSVSAHDRINGSPQMVRMWDDFLRYAKSRSDVVLLRKDEIARYVLQSPLTLRETETI